MRRMRFVIGGAVVIHAVGERGARREGDCVDGGSTRDKRRFGDVLFVDGAVAIAAAAAVATAAELIDEPLLSPW